MEKELRSLSAKSETAAAIRHALALACPHALHRKAVCWRSITALPNGRSRYGLLVRPKDSPSQKQCSVYNYGGAAGTGPLF
jgi:hypothetical protein